MQHLHTRARVSASVRSWRRRRRATALGAVAIVIGAAATSLVRDSQASAPIANGYEPATLASTNYAIPAGARFVSPSGSDANAGTQSAPFATLAKAVAAAPSGGTIVLRGGTYRESVDLARPVRIQAYPNERPWLVGTSVVTGFTKSGTTWSRSWTSSLCQTCFDPAAIDPLFPAAGLPDQAFVDGVPLTQVKALAQVTAGRFFLDTAARRVYLGTDPNGHAVELSAREYALRFTKAAVGSALLGVGVARYGASSIFSRPAMVQVDAAGVRLDSDTFAWSAARGVTVSAADVSITNSLFLYNGTNGVHATSADRLVFRGNRVARSNTERFDITPSASASQAGAKVARSTGSVFTGNLFDDNNANGLWFDVSSDDTVIADNTSVANAGHGIAYEVSGDAIIAGNLVANNARHGVKLSGASGAEVWNNTIVGNGWSQLGVYEDPRTNPNATERAAGITWDTNNVRVMNTLLVAPPTATRPVFESFDVSSPRSLTSAQMLSANTHNAWARPVPSITRKLSKWQLTLSTVAQYASLGAMQSATSREGTSTAADGQPLSALFRAPASGDFTPKTGGPLAYAGAAVPARVAAAMGTGTAVPMGAPNPPAISGSPSPTTTSATTAPPPSTATTSTPTTSTPTTSTPTTSTPPTNSTTTTAAPPPTTTTTASGLPRLAIANATAPEGLTPLGKTVVLALRVTLSQAASNKVTVDYTVLAGTAAPGSDYTAAQGTLTWTPGTSTRRVLVTLTADAVREPDEMFSVRLSNAVGAVMVDDRATATIVNDD